MRNHVSIYCVLVYILCSFWKYNIFFLCRRTSSTSSRAVLSRARCRRTDPTRTSSPSSSSSTTRPPHVPYTYTATGTVHNNSHSTNQHLATVYINSYRYSTHQQLQHCTHKQLELQYTSTATGTVHIKSYSYCTQKQLQLQYTSTASGQYTATCTVHINSYRSSTVKSCSTRTQLLL